MIYTLVWTGSAGGELAEIWIRSSDRNRISFAALEIDRMLRIDAQLKGEEVAEGLRAINVTPLRFLFSVNEADRTVEIAVVREI